MSIGDGFGHRLYVPAFTRRASTSTHAILGEHQRGGLSKMKSILVPFRDDETARSAVAAACAVAKQFSSHIEGLFIQTPPLVYASEGIAIGGYVTQLADEEKRRADEAQVRFRELMAAQNVTMDDVSLETRPNASWQQVDGLSEQIVGEYGRLFDLIAIGRETKNASPDWSVMCESALFDSGRLILLASPTLPSTMGEVISILWNGSTETANTIAMSMPFLAAAKEVKVLCVTGVSVPGPSGEQIAKSLSLHGIPTSVITTDIGDRTPGEAVLEDAYSSGADLLLKGAYANSRLRQMIFGGPTRQILSSTELPVLMGH
ncbi:MAG: nucleotide-binding universal stress UspA family protein [Gammaproteobacteria bacterium]|jgi:nucleotide-binding universal stress UspA family protein